MLCTLTRCNENSNLNTIIDANNMCATLAYNLALPIDLDQEIHSNFYQK